jgi:hypothetical protein
MNTNRLIDILSTNLEPVKPGQIGKTLASALIIGGVVAFCLMLATVGLRPDIASGRSLGFLALKLLFTLSLICTGAASLFRLMHPGRDSRKPFVLLLLAFAALVVAGLAALAIREPAAWSGMVFGMGWLSCLVCIPLFAIIPFAALIWALRNGAPTNLKHTGAVAGLLAGSLGAAAYAFHCPGDSLPFIAIWYGTPIAASTLIGALLGPRLLRW